MDAFITRKRRRASTPGDDTNPESHGLHENANPQVNQDTAGDESTDIKLAILISLFPTVGQDDILDVLVSCDGSVEAAHLLDMFPHMCSRTPAV